MKAIGLLNGKTMTRKNKDKNFYRCIETGEVLSSSEWIDRGYRAYRLKTKGLHFEKM